MIVVIDAGHGGEDPGAIGPSGLTEANVVLSVAGYVARRLSPSWYPVLTRFGDSFRTLDERAQFANRISADLFVSIHANAHSNRSAHGFEVWTSPGETASDAVASHLYDSIGAAFPTLDARRDYSDGDADKEARFRVLVSTRMPAVLVELAFISNPAEELLLANATIRKRFADAIVAGVESVAEWSGDNMKRTILALLILAVAGIADARRPPATCTFCPSTGDSVTPAQLILTPPMQARPMAGDVFVARFWKVVRFREGIQGEWQRVEPRWLEYRVRLLFHGPEDSEATTASIVWLGYKCCVGSEVLLPGLADTLVWDETLGAFSRAFDDRTTEKEVLELRGGIVRLRSWRAELPHGPPTDYFEEMVGGIVGQVVEALPVENGNEEEQ